MGIIDAAIERNSQTEFVEERLRKSIQEIVRSYRNSWDPYSETIQNSVDAINRRFRILNDPDFHLYHEYREEYEIESDPSFEGAIKIIINAEDNTIEVRDNGVGMREEEIEEFLLPQGTDKEVGQEYGFKGYGLTYATFISKYVDIKSRHFHLDGEPGSRISIEGLFDWLCDESGEVSFPDSPRPDVETTDQMPDPWNTIVRLELAEQYSGEFPAISACDDALSYARDEQYLDGLEYMLRTHTAIGNTRPLFNKAPIVPIEISLDVTFPNGDKMEDIEIPYRYYHPKDHEQIDFLSFSFDEYFDEYRKPDFDKDFRALYHTINDVTVGSQNPIECDFAICAIASSRLSNIESSMGLSEIESSDIGISYGVHLAIDGMPLGLRVDNWDSKGGNIKRYYVVVNAELDVSNQLDSGRKGISRYYGRLISDKAHDLISSETVNDSEPFASYASSHLDHGQGRSPGGLPPQDFRTKVQNVRENGSDQDEGERDVLSEVSDLIYLPTNEQEVVSLFYQLLSKRIIKGYNVVYHAGSSSVYDAAFEYEVECNDENSYPGDELGIGRVMVQDLDSMGEDYYRHEDHYQRTTYHPELCVEFKKSVGGLLDEIINRPSRSNKDVNAIDLLICWDSNVPSSIPQTAYTLDPKNNDRRIFHGTTHSLGITNPERTDIPCIVLKDLLYLKHDN